MDLSFSDIITYGSPLLVFWAVGAWATRLIPNAPGVCDKVELVKKVLNFIGEAPEWVYYNENLEADMESLKSLKERLLCVEKDVSQEVEMLEFQNNAKMKREVKAWLRNVRRIDQEVRNLESEMGQTGRFSRFLFRAWIGSCVEKKKKEVNRLLEQKGAFEQRPVITAHRVGREKLVVSQLVGQFAQMKKEAIWGHLKCQEVKILGVEGDQGMGKSTTMRHIYNQVLDETELFDCAFYVTIKGEKSDYQLQTAIGKELELSGLEDEDDETRVVRRAARIGNALKLAKRFVLILDGLMSPFELHNVGIPLESNGGIGKLVMVSQSKKVCDKMLCRPVIRLDELPFEDASELFMETLKPQPGALSEETVLIAEDIIGKCNGVPIRIIDASVSLRNEDDVSNWRKKLSEL